MLQVCPRLKVVCVLLLTVILVVPIYDARDVVDFDLSALLSSLSALPLYEHGLYDLPYNCAVIVGYAIGVCKSHVPHVLPYMSWCVRWVMLLSLPKLWERYRIVEEFPDLPDDGSNEDS